MLEITKNTIKNFRVQVLLAGMIVLFAIKAFFNLEDSFWVLLLNDVVVIVVFYYLILLIHELFFRKNNSPVSLVVSILILFSITIFIINIFGLFLTRNDYKGLVDYLRNIDSISLIIGYLLNLYIMVSLAYSFLVFRELFFLKQKRNFNTLYTALIIFLLLASFSSVLDGFENLQFIKLALSANAIILITINSARISWIAFLSKKQKRQLLLISIGMIILFIFYLVSSATDGMINALVHHFSYSLNQFNILISIYGIIYFGFLFFTTLFHLPTAEAFDRKASEISTLQYFSKMINQVLDYNELLDTISEQSLNVSNSDHSWIVMNNDATQTPIALKNIGYVNASRLINEYSKRVLLTKTGGVASFNLNNSYISANENEKVCELAVAQFKTHNQVNGLLFLSRRESIPFDEEDKNLIQTFADYASIAIENSRLLVESIEKERLEKELDVAREMQLKLLPHSLPSHPELEIAAVFIPAFEVGGDYYDFFELDKDKMGFIIADVSGKGTSAAFVMAEIRGIFETLSKLMINPKEILISANKILSRTLEKKSFVSAIYGYIDKKASKIVFCRAGHPSLILLRNNEVTELTPAGCGLGLTYSELFENSLQESEINLQKEDAIILYTDGITEAKNINNQDFGIEKLTEIIAQCGNLSADELSSEIIQKVTIFSENNSQHDDITLVIFKWKQ